MAKREVPPIIARLGALVARLRTDHGLSQSDLAERADISTKRVGEIERGAPDLRIMTAVRLADALGVPPYSLLAPEGFVPPNTDPALIRNFELVRVAFDEFGQSLGLPRAQAGASAPSALERPRHRKRTRSKSKKP